MALNLYEYDEENSLYVLHSKNGVFSSPVQTSHDGTNGQVVEKKLYLKNNDGNFYYTGLSLQPLPLAKTGVDNLSYPEAFVTFKVIYQDDQPSSGQWAAVSSGSEVSISDIGDEGDGDVSYKPLWIQVSIPSSTPLQNINDIYLHLAGEENPV